MQWLRHTRFEPPTITEQQQDMMRQDQMRMLASQADARWASKPSALDAPDKQQPVQMLKSRDPDTGVVQTNVDQQIRDRTELPPNVEEQDPRPQQVEVSTPSQQMPHDPPEPADAGDAPSVQTRKRMKKEPRDSPWKQATRNNPGEDWQPQGWSPAPARKRA